MAHRFRRAALICAVALLAGCGASPQPGAASGGAAAQAAPKPADWSALEASVGRYPADIRLYDDSPLSADLTKLLGTHAAAFRANMQVSGPLQKEGATLYVTGNKPHEGGSDAAYLLIDPVSRSLEVGLWEQGQFTILHGGMAALTRPKDVETMIANLEHPAGGG